MQALQGLKELLKGGILTKNSFPFILFQRQEQLYHIVARLQHRIGVSFSVPHEFRVFPSRKAFKDFGLSNQDLDLFDKIDRLQREANRRR